jgi:uncharacterized membrane protein
MDPSISTNRTLSLASKSHAERILPDAIYKIRMIVRGGGRLMTRGGWESIQWMQ